MQGLSPALAKRAYSVSAMRDLARRALPQPVFDFADGGAEDETTLRRNEEAFADIDLLPAPLRGSPQQDLSTTLFGERLSMPLIVGPTGLAGLFWPDGERCAMRAAAAQGIPYCLSHGSVCSLEDLAAAGPGNRWMQVFVYRDRGFTRELTARAFAADYQALVLTIDNQCLGKRERDLRNGFVIPPRIGPAGLAMMATKWRWLLRMRREFSRITFGNYVRPGEKASIQNLAGRMASLLDPAMTWKDVDALRDQWQGRPLVLKGILSPEEARIALDHGVDALIVSNHGGRQLDGAVASLDILPRIVDAVGGRIPVLMDGGVRRGADVVRAMALGASACLIGRPQLWGLSVGGEAGVAHVLDIYRREMERTLGLCGLSSIAGIDSSLIFRRHERNLGDD